MPKFPAITRDLSIICDDEIPSAKLEAIIKKSVGKILEKVTLFDVYKGKQIAEGKKSMAFTMQFQSNEKTLTDAEADEAFQRILSAVQQEFQAELRA